MGCVGKMAAETVADLRFQGKVARLHGRGPRVLAELLAELGAERLITTLIEQKIDHYLAITDEALDATDGHNFPPLPIHKAKP